MDSPEHRLASYGSLAPGRVNHHQLAGLRGRWVPGTVHGRLFDIGSYPGLTLDPSGPVVELQVFESADLPAHWHRLDVFEGADYRRVATRVHTADGDLDAYIYVAEPSAFP